MYGGCRIPVRRELRGCTRSLISSISRGCAYDQHCRAHILDFASILKSRACENAYVCLEMRRDHGLVKSSSQGPGADGDPLKLTDWLPFYYCLQQCGFLLIRPRITDQVVLGFVGFIGFLGAVVRAGCVGAGLRRGILVGRV